ncbi:MAG: hypothetical protein QNJ46_30125 [Leptolyngbyaceae cyanobacterium MO_188.B28]|nr:hypothetical protein [Leptolyngbyaceae cyanobacterium MO_188.B28]
MDPVLDQAVRYLANSSGTLPTHASVVETLLEAEKITKQTKVQHAYSQLLGNWRLGFITGTKRTRQRAGVVLGAGRFLPRWVKIYLTYVQPDTSLDQGTIQNQVDLGPLQLILTGPTRFWSKKNILAFDFTRLKATLSGLKLYEGFVRGGRDREATFQEQRLKGQAFFTYFLVEADCIAARGKGGGLALWVREEG